jgi:hypothetical protein
MRTSRVRYRIALSSLSRKNLVLSAKTRKPLQVSGFRRIRREEMRTSRVRYRIALSSLSRKNLVLSAKTRKPLQVSGFRRIRREEMRTSRVRYRVALSSLSRKNLVLSAKTRKPLQVSGFRRIRKCSKADATARAAPERRKWQSFSRLMGAGEMNFAPTTWAQTLDGEGYADGKKSVYLTDATAMVGCVMDVGA